MKIHTKLTFLGSLAILSTSPLALAHKAVRHAVTAEPTADTVTDTTTTDPAIVDGNTTDAGGTTAGTDTGSTDGGTSVDGSTGNGGVVGPDGGGVVVDPVKVEDHTGTETPVPLDWVKRGIGDNPDVIFYNMAGGPVPVFKGETSPVAKQIGPDGKATAIEGKDNSGALQLNREKKGPVALVKKGRVFLR